MNILLQPLSTFLTAEMPMPNIDIGNTATGVVNISEAISKYGIAIVIMAVFFIIFMILIIIMLYSNTRMINQIIASKSASDQQDQTIISKFIDNALNEKGVSSKEEIVNTLSNELKESLIPITQKLEALSKAAEENPDNKDDYHKDIVGAYIDINMAFKDISRSTLVSLDCDRIAIYVFHNGNQSSHGLPFFKMSCIHEWTHHGINTFRGKSHIDLPLHLFNDFMENLYQTGYYKTEDVTKDMRRKAKAVNFGIVYGQSKYGLAKSIGISNAEAQEFIDKYFEHYPKVKQYMEDKKQFANQNGYVETIFGRKRYLASELMSPNFQIREFAQRAAINQPLQGTAADLIKKAMIEVDKQI